MPAPRTEYLLDRIRRVLSELLGPVADSVGRRLDSQLPADEFAEFRVPGPAALATRRLGAISSSVRVVTC
jgi:hypothetical protein